MCEQDPFCCNTQWDALCVSRVESYGCGICSPCADALGVGDLPQQLTATTVGAQDFYTASCGNVAEGSGDYVVIFEAPEAGTYVIDTNGSDYDTNLAVLDGDCSGSEIGCNDDGGDGTRSQLVLDLAAGQRVTIIVDGYNGAEGSVVLNVQTGAQGDCCTATAVPGCTDPAIEACVCEVWSDCCSDSWDSFCVTFAESHGCVASCSHDCADGTVHGASSFGRSGSTVDAPDRYTPTCGAGTAGSGDYVLVYRPPATGWYSFNTNDSEFDTTLTILDGACDGPVLACNDDGGVSTRSQITLQLTASQEVILIVDGYNGAEGEFVLWGGSVGSGGVCCAASTEPGCAAEPEIESCVCAEIPSCCDTEWDGSCASAVEMYSCGYCE